MTDQPDPTDEALAAKLAGLSRFQRELNAGQGSAQDSRAGAAHSRMLNEVADLLEVYYAAPNELTADQLARRLTNILYGAA
ncbi:MAG TPA: hypothetical protein VH539_15045 [Gemmatimonadaceae bacterium]